MRIENISFAEFRPDTFWMPTPIYNVIQNAKLLISNEKKKTTKQIDLETGWFWFVITRKKNKNSASESQRTKEEREQKKSYLFSLTENFWFLFAFSANFIKLCKV